MGKLEKQIRSNIASCKHENVVISKATQEYLSLRKQGKVNVDSVVKELVAKYVKLTEV